MPLTAHCRTGSLEYAKINKIKNLDFLMDAKTYSRPDRTEALKKNQEAIEHDKWFRAQVEQALIEADDPATVWVSHEDVIKGCQKQRESLQARIDAEANI